MTGKANKMLLRVCALLLCTLLMSGCRVQQEYPPQLSPSAATPPPVDTDGTGTLSVTLYYRSADGQLSSEQRDVEWPAGVSRAQVALKALCAAPDSAALNPVIPEGLTFERVELSGDVCDVYLTGEMPDNGQSLLVARAAIAATVQANEGIPYIDVYVNGVQPGYDGRPLGVLKPIEGSLNAYLAQYASSNVDTGTEAGTLESRDAQLYFSDTSEQLLLCDVVTMRYDRNAEPSLIISALLGELMKGPLASEGREPVLPTDMQLKECFFSNGSDDQPNEQGGQSALASGVVELHFARPAGEFDERMVYASIVYTVMGFWPGVEGVRIYLDGEIVYPGDVPGVQTRRSVFKREDFAGVLGHTATLAFPDQDGLGLYPVLRCMGQDTVYDPRMRLTALFAGTADLGVSLTMFQTEDVLCVSIQGNMAVVNWRAGFYDTLVGFVENGVSHLPKSARARMVVFAMVNTLCNIPGVQRVWMLEDGQRIDKSIGYLYLGNALLYNPGLMLS